MGYDIIIMQNVGIGRCCSNDIVNAALLIKT